MLSRNGVFACISEFYLQSWLISMVRSEQTDDVLCRVLDILYYFTYNLKYVPSDLLVSILDTDTGDIHRSFDNLSSSVK